MFLANDVHFLDKQHYNTRIESGNRKLKQSFTDAMDLHNVDVVTKQSCKFRFSVFLSNDAHFPDDQHYKTRIESGNCKSKQSLADTMCLHNADSVTKKICEHRFSMFLVNDAYFSDKRHHFTRIESGNYKLK